MTIGRRSTNEVVVNDLKVSRTHCRVSRGADGFFINDLNSRNGTYLNGRPVQSAEIKHGDEVAVGSALFVFLTEPEKPVSRSVEVRLNRVPG